MTHRGPFQPRTFCDSVKSCSFQEQEAAKLHGGWRGPAFYLGKKHGGGQPDPTRGTTSQPQGRLWWQVELLPSGVPAVMRWPWWGGVAKVGSSGQGREGWPWGAGQGDIAARRLPPHGHHGGGLPHCGGGLGAACAASNIREKQVEILFPNCFGSACLSLCEAETENFKQSSLPVTNIPFLCFNKCILTY